MPDINTSLDIIKIIREVSKQNIDNFELEYEGIKIKMSGGKVLGQPAQEMELPKASKEDLEEIEAQEEKTIIDRVKEKDESLLEDLDYLSPELAGDLRRANVIRMNSQGTYEYIEEDRVDA